MGWYYLQHSAQHLHDGHSSWEKTSVRSEETAAGKGEQVMRKRWEGNDSLRLCWDPETACPPASCPSTLACSATTPGRMLPPGFLGGGAGAKNASETTGLCEITESLHAVGLQTVLPVLQVCLGFEILQPPEVSWRSLRWDEKTRP